MPNITFDFSRERIIHPKKRENLSYTFRDIGTSNIRLIVDNLNKTETVKDSNTSNFDKNAIKASLTNILNFRNGERILDPEFGMGTVYEMIYSPFDKYTTQKMIKTMQSIISAYEPRISITSTPTTYNEDTHEFFITINYYIPELKEDDSYQFTIGR